MPFMLHKISCHFFVILIFSITFSANRDIATGIDGDHTEHKSMYYNDTEEILQENQNLNLENESDQMFRPSFLLTTDDYINNRQRWQAKGKEYNSLWSVPTEGTAHLFFSHSADKVVNTNFNRINWQRSKTNQSLESMATLNRDPNINNHNTNYNKDDIHFEAPYEEQERNKSLLSMLSTVIKDKGNYIFLNHKYDSNPVYNTTDHSVSVDQQQETYDAQFDTIDGDYKSIKEETYINNAAEGERTDQLEFASDVTDPTSIMDTATYKPLRPTVHETENGENNTYGSRYQVKLDRYGQSSKRFKDYHNRYDTYYDTEITGPDDISIPHTHKHLPIHPYYAPKPTSQFDWTHLGILALVKLAIVKLNALGLMKLVMILLLKFPIVLIMFGLKMLVLVKVIKLTTLPILLLFLVPLLLLPLVLGPLLFLPLLLPLLLLLPIPVLAPVTTTTPPPATTPVPASGRKRRSTDPDDDILELVRNVLLAEECLEMIECQLAANEGQPSYIVWSVLTLLEKASQLTTNSRFHSLIAAYKIGLTSPDSCSLRYSCNNSRGSFLNKT